MRGSGHGQFDAIPLTVEVGEVVAIHSETAGFYWLTTEDGRTGWVPCSYVIIDK